MNQFTPGPWSLNLRSGLPYSVSGFDKKTIASWHNVRRTVDVIAANALLISLAPDMYDIITELNGMLKEYPHGVIPTHLCIRMDLLLKRIGP